MATLKLREWKQGEVVRSIPLLSDKLHQLEKMVLRVLVEEMEVIPPELLYIEAGLTVTMKVSETFFTTINGNDGEHNDAHPFSSRSR